MRPRGLTEATLVILFGAALAVVLTYPLAFRLTHIGRLNSDDGRWSIWVVAWVAHALTTDPLHVYDANIFYPHASALAFSEANLVAGAIGAPIWLLTKNPYTTHNVVVLIGFVLSFAGAYYLTRYLSGSRPAGLVAGVLFAFCPFIFARTAHIQLLMTAALPFCMLAFHRLVDRPTVSRAVVLGTLIWASALACAYYGVFAILMVGLGTVLFAATRRMWRSKDYWLGIGLAAFVSAGLTLPFFLPYLEVQQEQGFARTLDDARQTSVNVGAWGASAAWAHRWWLPALGKYNEVLFPGVLLTVLGIGGALWVLSRNRGAAPPSESDPAKREPAALFPRDVALLYVLIALLAFWSSFGPDAGLYWIFYKTIPIFTFMRAPGRMGIMVVLALTVLAAPLVAAVIGRTRRPMLAGVALALVASAELMTAPLTGLREAEPLPYAYRVLATLPRAPVIEMPYWHQRMDFPRHAYYMLNSTAHWMPLVNGYSDHIPADFRRRVLTLSSFPTRDSFFILSLLGARYVVFHLDFYDQRSELRLNERLESYSKYLRPLVREGDVWLFEIVDWPN